MLVDKKEYVCSIGFHIRSFVLSNYSNKWAAAAQSELDGAVWSNGTLSALYTASNVPIRSISGVQCLIQWCFNIQPGEPGIEPPAWWLRGDCCSNS